MLDVLRRGQRWILAAVIVTVGAVFVLYIGVGQPLQRGPADTVVTVGDHHYDLRDFGRVREQQQRYYEGLLGDNFDARAAAPQLDSVAANILVQRAILVDEAERLGVRVTLDEIRDAIRAVPGLRGENGQFDREQYRRFVDYEYGTEQRFVEAIREDLLVQKVLALLASTADVSAVEARDALRLAREEVRLALVVLDGKTPPADFAVDDAAIDALLAGDATRVRTAYDQRQSEFNAPERVRARHILLRVPSDATPEKEEEVRVRAEEVLKRVRSGEDFAKVAAEASEDPGSKERGGDLGFFERGRMVKAFEDAAFSRPPGEVGDVVRSEFGFHVLRVEEKTAASSRAFDEVKRDLARELLAKDAGREHARALAERVAAEVRAGRSLEEAARGEKLTLERTEWIRRRPDGYVPGAGASPELLHAAFALPDARPSSDRIFEVGDNLVLVQRLEKKTPDEATLQASLEPERERLLGAKKNELHSAWIEARRTELADRGQLLVDLEVTKGGATR
jgi:peptidyl-prolyl cis-trans isomerase D